MIVLVITFIVSGVLLFIGWKVTDTKGKDRHWLYLGEYEEEDK